MTDTQLIWIGIVSQAIPTITAILMVTVGNWYERRINKLMEKDIADDELYELDMENH